MSRPVANLLISNADTKALFSDDKGSNDSREKELFNGPTWLGNFAQKLQIYKKILIPTHN